MDETARKRKILFVMNTMGRAGAERALVSLMKSLPAGAFEMELYSIIPRGEMFAELPGFVTVRNRRFAAKSVMDLRGKLAIALFVIKNLLKGGYVFKNFTRLWRGWRAESQSGRFSFDKFFWPVLAAQAPLIETRYDLVVGYLEGAATYYAASLPNAAKRAGFVHVDYLKAGYAPETDRPYYQKLDAVFCVSDKVRESFVAAYPEFAPKTGVFHNILLPAEIRGRAGQGPGFEDGFGGLRVLTVARLHPQKALDISIAACRILRDEGVGDFRWYVMGEGEERRALERLIAQNRLEGTFVLLGARPNPYPFFAGCDVYVQASHFEGWSLSIEEALILQKPTVIAQVAGGDEQVQDGETGFVIQLTARNLAEAVKKLLTDALLRERFTQNLAGRKMQYDRDLGKLYALMGMDGGESHAD